MALKNIVVVGSLLSFAAGNAQIAVPFEEWKAHGTVAELDSAYMSAVNTDSTLAAFRGREDEFTQVYFHFYKELDGFLSAHDFQWPDTVHCFNKLYFSPDGKVERYLFGFHGALDAERQSRFQQLADAFLKTYVFPLKNSVPFRQCGGSTFVPKK